MLLLACHSKHVMLYYENFAVYDSPLGCVFLITSYRIMGGYTDLSLSLHPLDLTLLQFGVKAPGTAIKTPFLPANRSRMLTFVPGAPSSTSMEGRDSPT